MWIARVLVACGAGASDATLEPAVPEFGLDPTFVVLADGDDKLREPRDLGFSSLAPSELWVVNRATDAVVIVHDATTTADDSEKIVDCAANHFMEEVAAIAWSDNGLFGTAQESRNTYDDNAPPNDFMGPALWNADRSVFGVVNQDCSDATHNGSHIDMLHESPLGMGMAWDAGNAYWYFDGDAGELVWYDFQAPHGPGEDDHSDGIVYRYPEVALNRTKDVPGHMEVDRATGQLFIADTGGQALVVVDTHTGSIGETLISFYEPLEEYAEVEGVEIVRHPLDLEQPSGLALHEGRVFVGDHATGTIVAYDPAGAELGRVVVPSGEGLAGLEFGGDGRLYYVDRLDNLVGVITP